MTLLSPAVDRLTELAFLEDLAYGDITTDSLFPDGKIVQAQLATRQHATLSGLAIAQSVFEKTDSTIRCTLKTQDGQTVESGTILMYVEGPVGSILKAERLALNFLQHLSGIATLTHTYVQAISGTGARMTHTRKTIPGLRSLEIQAVMHGGGSPHRLSLSHAVLVKDNHLQAFGPLPAAIARIRESVGHTVRLEVECDTLAQVEQAAETGVDIILLDNMPPEVLRQAVAKVAGRAILEASGGISLANVRGIAETGVDIISTSQITMSAPAVDIGLDFL